MTGAEDGELGVAGFREKGSGDPGRVDAPDAEGGMSPAPMPRVETAK